MKVNKVYIVKHYWENGENATWESHAKVDKQVFEYLKKNYHNFVKNRPTMMKESKKYIYLCYENTLDAYDRKITNVTFFVSKYKLDGTPCDKITNTDYPNLELSLSSKEKMKFLLKWVSLIVLGLIIVGLLFNLKNKREMNIEIQEKLQDINLSKKDINFTSIIRKEKIINKMVKGNEKLLNNENRDNINKLRDFVSFNKKIKEELLDINLSIKDINFTFITEKVNNINEKIKGKEKLLIYENNRSISKLRDFVSINKKIQDLNTDIKNTKDISECKKDFTEIKKEYKDKGFSNIYTNNNIEQSKKLLTKYRDSLLKKKIKGE
jgi:hypothetical protein